MRIAVVGAGIAGLSAAAALSERGHQVVVFEKTSAPGGRMGTRRANAIDVPTRAAGPGRRSLGGGGRTIGRIASAGPSVSFDHGAQYFTARTPDFARLVDAWIDRKLVARWSGRIVSFDGEGWEPVADGTERYVGVPDMSAVCLAIASSLDVRYGHRVLSIESLADFDRIVIAVPAPQARRLSALAPEVTFASCWAVLAAFEEPVGTPFDAAFVAGSPLGWIARNTSKPKRDWKTDAWVLHAATTWSAAHLDDEPDLVGAFLMEAFEDLVRGGLPRALYATTHRWRYATADPPLAAGALRDRTGRIIVCGDWCLGSRVEDACLSGLRAAELVEGEGFSPRHRSDG